MKPGDRVRLDPATNGRTGRKAHHWTRLGTVLPPKPHSKLAAHVCHVLWDGRTSSELIHPRFLELVEVADEHA